MFCSAGGATVEEAGILENWISVKSLFFNLSLDFPCPATTASISGSLGFINSLDGISGAGGRVHLSCTQQPPIPQLEKTLPETERL